MLRHTSSGAHRGAPLPPFQRLALLALAPHLRREYGADIAYLFRERFRRERQRGRIAASRYALVAIVDFMSTAVRTRFGRSPTPDPLADLRTSPLRSWTPDMFLRDFRFAIRTLLHQPGFTAVVLITLGLGIGAFDVGNRQITGGDIPQNLRTAFWWGDPLTVLGMSPKHGRFFSPREIREMAPLALVSNRVFEARFAGDPDMIGQTIQINGVDHTLIGVFPSAATVYGIDLWTPMWAQPEDFSRTRRVMNLIARLGDGVTLAQANAELEAVARRTELEYAGQHDEYLGWRLETMTWTDANVRTLKPTAFVLMGTVSFVLLLVCANVANLLLSRSASRRREMAVRAALGAGRAHIVRQLLSESLLMAVLGGAVGLALGWVGLQWLVANTLACVIGGRLSGLRRCAGWRGGTT